jgi:hypothetical protein
MITLSLEEKVMQQKYKVLSFAIVAALYIFLVPSTSHAQTHVPNTLAGDPACGGGGGRGMAGWTLGCDRIPLNGAPKFYAQTPGGVGGCGERHLRKAGAKH